MGFINNNWFEALKITVYVMSSTLIFFGFLTGVIRNFSACLSKCDVFVRNWLACFEKSSFLYRGSYCISH